MEEAIDEPHKLAAWATVAKLPLFSGENKQTNKKNKTKADS